MRRLLLLSLLMIQCGVLIAIESPAPAVAGSNNGLKPEVIHPATKLQIAVYDFEVKTQTPQKDAWMARGIPDLLEIELQRHGLITLDRSQIYAVLHEQRQVHGCKINSDTLTTCRLIGADYILTGVIEQDGNQHQLLARLLNVKTSETAGTASLDIPEFEQLNDALANLTDTLIRNLPSKACSEYSSQQKPPNAEALMMFHRGLDACARNVPEAGVAWFNNAYNLDPNFTLAGYWEDRAYEMAGFTNHAEITKNSLQKDSTNTLNSASISAEKQTEIWSLLDPLIISPTNNIIMNNLTSKHIKTRIERAALRSGRIRILDPARMAAMLTEKDLTLSGLFAQTHSTRYASWLFSTVALKSVLRQTIKGDSILELSAINLMQDNQIKTLTRPIGILQDPQALTAAINDLVNATYVEVKTTNGTLGFAAPTTETVNEVCNLLERYHRNLAQALIQARQTPMKHSAHISLANTYGKLGNDKHCALEIERCINSLDISKEWADVAYYGVYRWLYLSGGPARRLQPALKYVDHNLLVLLETNLTEYFPNSLATACLHYERARKAWEAKRYTKAAEYATLCNSAMKAAAKRGKSTSPLILIASAGYIEGMSLTRMGKTEQALKLFEDILTAIEKEKKNITYHLAIGIGLSVRNGKTCIGCFGGSHTIIKKAIIAEIEIIKGEAVESEAQKALKTVKRNSTEGDRLFCIVTAESWEKKTPPRNTSLFSICGTLGKVRNWLGYDVSHALFIRLRNAYMGKPVTDPVTGKIMLTDEELLDAAPSLSKLYSAAGETDEFKHLFEHMFLPGNPPASAIRVLGIVPYSGEEYQDRFSRLADMLPDGKDRIPARLWIKLASTYIKTENYPAAINCYHKAATGNTTSVRYAGFETTAIRAALADSHKDVREKVRKLYKSFNMAETYPYWTVWFNEARRYHKAEEWNKAILCYEYVKDFLNNPEGLDSYYQLGEANGHGTVLKNRAKKFLEYDLSWSRQFKSNNSSTIFFLAECYIGAGLTEKAAPLLRKLSLDLGGEEIDVLQKTTRNGNAKTIKKKKLGIVAAELLESLHEKNGVKNAEENT